MCWLPSIEDLQSARQRPRDVSSEHFGAASPQPIKSECECATETRRTYCNIFCIINFHLHLPIDPPPPKKRDEGRRRWPALLRAWASYSRSSTTDHRNYQPYQRKKEKKHDGGKDLIIRSFAWWLLIFSSQPLICSPRPPPVFKTSVCSTEKLEKK